jgi:CRISPR-associated endonuclease/helicase Cas3
VRAPTGAGKTLSVLAPFILLREQIKVAGLIYVLPLRTLVEAISEEACLLAEPRGLRVAVQTGERADAEFFHDADIIVTTFDQLLSGLLCEPYGLSSKLWNINAAAIAGKMIVFDEFHLMEPDRAFASALFGVKLFKDLCVSVWMTATATSPLVKLIRTTLDAEEVTLSTSEQATLFEGNGISRRIRTHWQETLTPEHVLQHQGRKVLVVVNTVRRAQDLFTQLKDKRPTLLLHSRFFSDDRREKQRILKDSDLTIATQVIEAGVDISSDVLLTEAAPVNALVQRAGRCARFKNESGIIHIYGAPSPTPYTKAQIRAAQDIVEDTDSANPETCRKWVEKAHAEEDRQALIGFRDLQRKREQFVKNKVTGEEQQAGVASFIRPDEDTVRVFVLSDPSSAKPKERQAIQLRRSAVRQYQTRAWVFKDDEWLQGGDTKAAYAVALPPSIARYTKEEGLRLGASGNIESPPKAAKPRPGWGTLAVEHWPAHTENVIKHSLDRMGKEGLPESFADLVTWAAKLHDVGKLQRPWQSWALERQAKRGKPEHRALAHTDYDWKLDRGEPPPHHAAASALYGKHYLDELPERDRTSILLSVLAHHGGSIKGAEPADRLHPNAEDALGQVGLHLPKPISHLDFRSNERATIALSFYDVWPLTAILSRILRLSDQKATAESGYDEP